MIETVKILHSRYERSHCMKCRAIIAMNELCVSFPNRAWGKRTYCYSCGQKEMEGTQTKCIRTDKETREKAKTDSTLRDLLEDRSEKKLESDTRTTAERIRDEKQKQQDHQAEQDVRREGLEHGAEVKEELDSTAQTTEEILNDAKAIGALNPFDTLFGAEYRYLLKGHHESMETLLCLLRLGERVMICGPTGSGKTFASEWAFRILGMVDVMCPPVQDAFQLLGYSDIKGDYVPTPLYRWATSEVPAGLIMDELDRSDPSALLAINAALANSVAVFPNGQVKVPDTHQVVAPVNTWGHGIGATDFVGSIKQDAALLNRFTAKLFWGYDDKLENAILRGNAEKVSEAIPLDNLPKIADPDPKAVQIGRMLRKRIDELGVQIHWSPRDTFALGRRLSNGFKLREALECSTLQSTPKFEQLIDRVITKYGESK
jgi:MoxR-like ATPase